MVVVVRVASRVAVQVTVSEAVGERFRSVEVLVLVLDVSHAHPRQLPIVRLNRCPAAGMVIGYGYSGSSDRQPRVLSEC